MGFIIANLGTIIIGLIVAVVVGLVIFSLIRNKKKGKSSCGCGCGCGHCPNSSSCHK